MTVAFNPSKDRRGYKVNLLTSADNDWIHPWVAELKLVLAPFHEVTIFEGAEKMSPGDFGFLLGCTAVLSSAQLAKNKKNLLVHESDLPQGRGWSPVAWQVLAGQNRIPVVLLEAVDDLDAGPIYLRDEIHLDGTELLPEIRQRQGIKTMDLVCRFLEAWPDLEPEIQKGEATYYSRRTSEHDRLDINKSIARQFDHLRVVNNDQYPAWFEHRGRKYRLRITPMESR